MNTEIDHEYTSNIICPYCGAEDGDSWECMPEETDLGNIECCECGRTFAAERIISIEYSTHKIDWLKEWKRFNKKKIRNTEFEKNYKKRMLKLKQITQ